MNGVLIRKEGLPRLRYARRLSSKRLSELVGYTHRQVSRVENGFPTSFRFLDKLVPVFGVQAVADLIEDEQTKALFLAAHEVKA